MLCGRGCGIIKLRVMYTVNCTHGSVYILEQSSWNFIGLTISCLIQQSIKIIKYKNQSFSLLLERKYSLSASKNKFVVLYRRMGLHTRTGCPYAYGTGKLPIRVWDILYVYGTSHTRMGQNTRTIRNMYTKMQI